MPLDDDDNPALAPPAPYLSSALPADTATAAAPAATDDLTTEDLIEDEGAASQDFRAFAAALQFRKTAGVSAQTIRRGEKDFEAHGTRAQADALEQSRGAMRDVLSYTRVHAAGRGGNLARGWYFPGWWEGYREEEVEEGKEGEKKPFGFVRERVVVLEGSSVASQALGRAVTGQAKDRPARGRDWLLPEEALYLVERGSLDLWWPLKGLEELFPPDGTAEAVKEDGEEDDEDDEVDEYDVGFPLSLQAAYALLIGEDGERGKISLQKFQVYSNLKRCGYNILRAPPTVNHPTTKPATTTPLAMVRLTPHRDPPPSSLRPKWTKLRHPPPDFQLAVVDAQASSVPTGAEITALLGATPPAPGKPEWTGPGRIYARLKHGYRNVLVAVVDHGVINYMRFAEGGSV
ncbi:hypothetical protein CHGG_10174 [Chaetomium globosum CBS 148.51]|uniref:tRNA-splicing endonuclease subunit Sen54 N-terminal domain-containing protein n=1 Tax=Chaetomium globosum (strain ATCC 6205 / CBS 148.51 / DSM 1962 / NBRC 6347 / NRRL 1970) TaxID=306901 RepID=Q2GPD0_CHAGB|nr:uncharacterized protein CHGG_10174 [Chaetomium globosum CBS 148.51]EAQ83770.1 hypothetical protein CHGG_10174 [Chaetomium globosum CBS 148.51]